MLHVDGMKGARQGPTGSEARDQPTPIPRTWTIGKLSLPPPSTLAGAWQLYGGLRPLSGDLLASQRAEGMGHVCRRSRVMGPGRAGQIAGLSSLAIFSLTPGDLPGQNVSCPSGSSPGSTAATHVQRQPRASSQVGARSALPFPRQNRVGTSATHKDPSRLERLGAFTLDR